MNKAHIPKKMREGLWTECASMTTTNANMMVTPNHTVPSHQQFYGNEANNARSLREWGEIGIVTDHAKNKMNAKLDNKGRPCMLVNYAENHKSDVYRMWDLKTRRIVKSRDILWLNKTYGEYINRKNTIVDHGDHGPQGYEAPQNTTTGRNHNHNDDQDEGIQSYHVAEQEEAETMQAADPTSTSQAEEPTSTSIRQTRSSRINDGSPDESLNEKQLKEMRQLGGWFNPEAQEIIEQTEVQIDEEQANITIDRTTDEFAFSANNSQQYEEPTSFREAWDHDDPFQRTKWREAIHK
jgi:hypothetical protein